VIDWIIVIGHRPQYCSYNWSACCGNCTQQSYSPGWYDSSFAGELRASVEDLMYLYNVDIYLSGHVHAYERMWPVYNGSIDTTQSEYLYINPKYPVHIVSGAAGCVEAVPAPSSPMNWVPPVSVKRMSKYGFGLMTVIGNQEIQWQFIGSNITYPGEVLDTLSIKRQSY